MRGKQLLLRLSLWQVGITPARAGKTLLKSSRKSWTGDHPRACGENTQRSTVREPAARKLAITPARAGKTYKYTPESTVATDHPARAGKTSLRAATSEASEDHPRACGGKLDCSMFLHGREGITPARAGENKWFAEVNVRGVGSPPRVRGKTRRAFCNRWTARDHPRACGGRTARRSCCPAGGTDHPRACGENACLTHDCIIAYGSPPRVRGKH